MNVPQVVSKEAIGSYRLEMGCMPLSVPVVRLVTANTPMAGVKITEANVTIYFLLGALFPIA